MSSLFDEMDTRTMTERVSDLIEQMIVDGRFQPGDKLPTEYDLASQLHVGRSTVREAIKILVSKNVLHIVRGNGTFVSEAIGVMTDPLGFRFQHDKRQLALDLCEIRKMIEPRLAELAALHASESEIEQLQQICDEVAFQIRHEQPYDEKDSEFHGMIARCAGNQVVHALLPMIHAGISTYARVTEPSAAQNAPVTHQMVVDAIRARNPDLARKAMTQHLHDNMQTILGSGEEADAESTEREIIYRNGENT